MTAMAGYIDDFVTIIGQFTNTVGVTNTDTVINFVPDTG